MTYTEPETLPIADAVVIERSLREPDRFSEIFDRHHSDIHGYASRRLGPSLADDVAAETFLIAFDRRKRYDRSQPSARPWLYGIASNLIAPPPPGRAAPVPGAGPCRRAGPDRR
jgi:hypothetical protein